MAYFQRKAQLWREVKDLAEEAGERVGLTYQYARIPEIQGRIDELLARRQREVYEPTRNGILVRRDQRADTIEFSIEGKEFNTGEITESTAIALRDALEELLEDDEYFVRVFDSRDEQRYIDANNVPRFARTNNLRKYYTLANVIKKMLLENYYGQTLFMQLIPAQQTNPELDQLFDGKINCAIAPVIYHLNNQKAHSSGKIKKLLKLNEELKNGANSAALQKIADISDIKLCITDKLNKIWHEFCPKRQRSVLLMQVKGKHLITKYEKTLEYIENVGDIYTAEYTKVEFDLLKDKKCEFVDDLTDILLNNPAANVIGGKLGIYGVILDDIVYKLKFDEYEQYPDAFSAGGVGRLKFLEQNERFKRHRPNKFELDLVKTGIKAYYVRTEESRETNYKYDHNKSFKAWRQSGLFRGFPVLQYGFKVGKYLNECTELLELNGLMYVYAVNGDSLSIDVNGYYPTEILREYYNRGINPYVSNIIYGYDTFDFDETVMTNEQFRTFIGKTYQNRKVSIWRTNNKCEYLRAKYTLKDDIQHINYKNGIYEIHYKTNEEMWGLPVIYAYVLRHQKFIMFEHLNKLDQTPVHVCVDGIELKQPSNIFEIGTGVGQWKRESINMKMGQCVFKAENDEPSRLKLPKYDELMDNVKSIILNNDNIHISGSAGCGKTFLIKKLIECMDAQLCAPTHQAVHVLGESAKTYHSEFNAKRRKEFANIYIIDECSLVDAVSLRNMMSMAPYSRFIIVGDFRQLPVVEGIPINVSEIYTRFRILNLTENYRQKEDSEFFKICNQLRDINTLTDEQKNNIIDILNTRVVELPSYDSHDDIYLCGTNDEVDAVNSKFSLVNGAKIRCNKTEKNYYNGQIGTYQDGNVILNNDKIVKYEKSKMSLYYASTVHKAQGSTYRGNVIINPAKLRAENHLYVAITRATKLNNVYFTQPLTTLDPVYACV